MNTYTFTMTEDQLFLLEDALCAKIRQELNTAEVREYRGWSGRQARQIAKNAGLLLEQLCTLENKPNKPLIPNTDEQ